MMICIQLKSNSIYEVICEITIYIIEVYCLVLVNEYNYILINILKYFYKIFIKVC